MNGIISHHKPSFNTELARMIMRWFICFHFIRILDLLVVSFLSWSIRFIPITHSRHSWTDWILLDDQVFRTLRPPFRTGLCRWGGLPPLRRDQWDGLPPRGRPPWHHPWPDRQSYGSPMERLGYDVSSYLVFWSTCFVAWRNDEECLCSGHGQAK